MLRIPTAKLHELAAQAPKTHELGGHFRVRADGTLSDTILFEGEQCRNAEGQRISGAAQCRIHKPDAEISFHTHPKSNRPSSADMRNAVLKHPAVSGRGKRRLSLVLGPRGVWWYAPSPEMRRAWRARLRRGDKSFVKGAMRQWSKTGNRYVRGGGPPEQEDPHGFSRFMRAQGMHIRYVAYADLPARGTLVIPPGGAGHYIV